MSFMASQKDIYSFTSRENYQTMWQQYCSYVIEKTTSYLIIHVAEKEVVLSILDNSVNWAYGVHNVIKVVLKLVES